MDFERLARDFTQSAQLTSSPAVEIPCQKCGSAVLWLDAGGGRHCPDCDPPVVSAMVRRRVVISRGTGPRGADALVDVGGGREDGKRCQNGAETVAEFTVDIGNYWATLPGPGGIPTPEQCAAARGTGSIVKAAVKNSRKRRSKR